MGCTSSSSSGDEKGSSSPTPVSKSQSKDGYGSLTESKKPKKKSRQLQTLVAGAAQSGKSTFFKQLQLIHLNGWTDEEKVKLMQTLRSNIIQGMKELIEAGHDLELSAPDSLSTEVKLMEDKNPFDIDAVTSEVVTAAKRLWGSEFLQSIWDKRDTLPNLSVINLDYIMEHIDRITEEGALPTDEDVLRTRSRTTGSVELEFCYDNRQDFKFVDVGGQKSERRKWAEVIANPDAVLYFTSLPDYDIPVMVDSKKTRLQESLEIWETVTLEPAFAATTLILFLNKIDIFKEKLKTSSYKKTFPDYSGGAHDDKAAAKHMLGLFLDRMPEGKLKDGLQSHVTCALDTEQIRTVFVAIRASLTTQALDHLGI